MIGNQTVGYLAYVPYRTFSTLSNQENRADMAIVSMNATTASEKKQIGTALENAYEDAGIGVRSVILTEDERMEINSAFGIIIVLLMFMVVLLSFVGGLGLTGTMSLNVIDRSREIGVIRAFGGSNHSVIRIVVIEGVVIGAISWIISLILAIPLTWVFCDMIGHSFLNMGLAYEYSVWGALLWLGLVFLLAIIASSLPARSAARLTVREVLSYE
jgi:putative ABC transport system permease protein